jgi:hypothetical protein
MSQPFGNIVPGALLEYCTATQIAARYDVKKSTVKRWRDPGVATPNGRIRLVMQRIGGRYRTTWQAVEDFITALNSPPTGAAPLPASPAERRRHNQRTDAILERMGV